MNRLPFQEPQNQIIARSTPQRYDLSRCTHLLPHLLNFRECGLLLSVLSLVMDELVFRGLLAQSGYPHFVGDLGVPERGSVQPRRLGGDARTLRRATHATMMGYNNSKK